MKLWTNYCSKMNKRPITRCPEFSPRSKRSQISTRNKTKLKANHRSKKHSISTTTKITQSKMKVISRKASTSTARGNQSSFARGVLWTLTNPLCSWTTTSTNLRTQYGRTFWVVRFKFQKLLKLMAATEWPTKMWTRWDQCNFSLKRVTSTRHGKNLGFLRLRDGRETGQGKRR